MVAIEPITQPEINSHDRMAAGPQRRINTTACGWMNINTIRRSGPAPMKRLDLPKTLFYLTCAASILIVCFALGMYSASQKTHAFLFLRNRYRDVRIFLDDFSTKAQIQPSYFLQPARGDGSGVTINRLPGDNDELILLSGFFEDNNQIRLIGRDGSIVAKWPLSFSALIKDTSHFRDPPKTDWNVDLHGMLILPDGSIVFNFEYAGIMKLDRCGKVLWTLHEMGHHSITLAEDGGYWIPGKHWVEPGEDTLPALFHPPYTEDTVMKVSDTGEILLEFSVPQLMMDNGLEPLLSAGGESISDEYFGIWNKEILHLNKIAELPAAIAGDFPMFEAGDLALSVRMRNLVMVIDPDDRKIKWWRVGPWLRQHDPWFLPGGTISVFNNNMYLSRYSPALDNKCEIPRMCLSNIIKIDPVTDQHKVIYGGISGQELSTDIRGKHQWTPRGGMLITEFEGGRIFETDASGQVIWQYINRYNSEYVAEMTEAQLYQADYFTVSDWSCK